MALDPYSRFSLEYEHTPQEIVQELIAATYSFNNTVAEKAISGANDHVSLYPPTGVGVSNDQSFPNTPENAGTLAREALFCINSDSYGIGDIGGGGGGAYGEMDRQIPEFPEVLSSIGLVNLKAIFDAPVEQLRALVVLSAENRELAAQLARIVQSTLSPVGVNRSKEIGPNPNPGTRAPDSVGTVALSGKIGLDIAYHDLPLGALVELYVPSLWDVLNNEVWRSVPRLPPNLRGKIRLWARPFDPQRQASTVVTMLRNSRGVPYSTRPDFNPARREAARLDPDTKAADAMVNCLNTQFSTGFLAGFHHFAVVLERLADEALEVAAPAGAGMAAPPGGAMAGVNFLAVPAIANLAVRNAVRLSGLAGQGRTLANVQTFKEFMYCTTAANIVPSVLGVGGIPTLLGEKIGLAPATVDPILRGAGDQGFAGAYTVANIAAPAPVPNDAARAAYISETAGMKLHTPVVWSAFVKSVPETIEPLANVMKTGLPWVFGRVTRAARAGMSSTWSMHMS